MKIKTKISYKLLINPALLLFSIIIIILISELFLRIFAKQAYYVWTPYLKFSMHPRTETFPGIYGNSFLRINSLGMRADELNINAKLKIITIGGSTTECFYLDQNETWPAILQNQLTQKFNYPVWVGNIGKSGLNSYHNALQIKEILKQYKWIDLIIILTGVNDLQYTLSQNNSNYYNQKESEIEEKAFALRPSGLKFNSIKSFEIYKLFAKSINQFLFTRLFSDPNGDNYQFWRNNRKSAEKIMDHLPDLKQPLTNYENNICAMIKYARAYNKKIIFLTQPVLWDSSLSKYYQNLCWFGWIGGSQANNSKIYYSFSKLKKAMDLYNDVLKKVCNNENVHIIDLAANIEKDTSSFYDDCHLNESGARKTAGLIGNYISSNSFIKFK